MSFFLPRHSPNFVRFCPRLIENVHLHAFLFKVGDSAFGSFQRWLFFDTYCVCLWVSNPEREYLRFFFDLLVIIIVYIIKCYIYNNITILYEFVLFLNKIDIILLCWFIFAAVMSFCNIDPGLDVLCISDNTIARKLRLRENVNYPYRILGRCFGTIPRNYCHWKICTIPIGRGRNRPC